MKSLPASAVPGGAEVGRFSNGVNKAFTVSREEPRRQEARISAKSWEASPTEEVG